MNLAVASPAKDAAQAKSDYLFEIIVRDAQSAAMQIGCVASLLTQYASGRSATSLGAMRHFLNDESRVSQLALRFGPDAGLTAEAQTALRALHDSVAAGQRELAGLTRSTARGEAATAAANRWRRVAGAARDVLRQLQEPTALRLDAVFASDATTLQSFLQDAAAGRAERFDALGQFSPPPLRQRRQATRLDLRLACEVLHEGEVARGEIVNISSTGVGLRCERAIPLGAEIDVRLPDGRVLAVKVLHSQRGIFGARNKKTLTDAEILAFTKMSARA